MIRYVQERKEQLRIAKACHVHPTSGHMGVKKTAVRIKERFMWKGIIKDVQKLVSTLEHLMHVVNIVLVLLLQVSSCDMCQRINQKQVIEKPELHPIPVHSPWFHVGVDFVGPISPPSTSGNDTFSH